MPRSAGGLDQSIRIEMFGDLHENGALGRVVTKIGGARGGLTWLLDGCVGVVGQAVRGGEHPGMQRARIVIGRRGGDSDHVAAVPRRHLADGALRQPEEPGQSSRRASAREFLGVFKVVGWLLLGAAGGLGDPTSEGEERPMMVRHHRLAIAGVITAAAMAAPAAALASGPGSPSGKPALPQASAASAKKPAAGSQLTALAASAGISVSRLQAGLVAAKRTGGHTAAGIAAFAAATGVSHATAQRVLYAVMGTSPSGKPASPQAPVASASKSAAAQSVPAAVRALATRLGVSTSAAGRAFKQMAALSNTSGAAGPGSTAFAAIARDLGVSPARLAAAWDAVKPRVADK